ncbi:uncharacterized protein BO72DRAFT_230587 [Aspergillus fijiensis CBS 313.89]|uniref:Uncharacterized protein n=1 Tax=Aspergillus fijiensis CBS 313.89 TaxID=1448319 RepID=A0A8G1VVZ4_9EURO|nr:uncharacterized protein BO72DRAFT_230587 [Aspergillus fijiensis CBS 313.89]RAK73681.1 hypothetical protein BO72DRAFT_230587 [Aspergillus fijiensis CBS 313.89]
MICRMSQDWEIGTPIKLVGQAAELLESELYATQYRRVKPWPYYNPCSLIHTYHRFTSREINCYFFLVPSIDMHLNCDPFRLHTQSPRVAVSQAGCLYPELFSRNGARIT